MIAGAPPRAMRTDPRLMSDQQLLAACTLRPWERRLRNAFLSGLGCAAQLAAAAAAVAVAPGLVPSLDFPKSLVLVLPVLWLELCLAMAAHSLAERRRNVFWREIGRRYGGTRLKDCVRELDDDTAQGASRARADACVILGGAALPHGGSWLVRVWLLPHGGGAVERRSVSPGYLADDSAEHVRLAAGEAPLTAEEADGLRGLLDAARDSRNRRVDSDVKDGAPAEVAVWLRGRGVVFTGECNLAGIPPAAQNLPVVRLMQAVQALGAKVTSPPLLVGAFNHRTGEILLGGA